MISLWFAGCTSAPPEPEPYKPDPMAVDLSDETRGLANIEIKPQKKPTTLRNRFQIAECLEKAKVPLSEVQGQMQLQFLQDLDPTVQDSPDWSLFHGLCISSRKSELKDLAYTEKFMWDNQFVVQCYQVSVQWRGKSYHMACFRQDLDAQCTDLQGRLCTGVASHLGGQIEGCVCKSPQPAEWVYPYK